jgi:hypothetical protein
MHKFLASQFGASHPYCKELAKIHSQALDFSKKGKYQNIPNHILQFYE